MGLVCCSINSADLIPVLIALHCSLPLASERGAASSHGQLTKHLLKLNFN